MLVYRSSGLTIAELWFDESDLGVRADIVRYSQALTPPVGAACTPFCTLVVDLARAEDEILGSMSKETRYEIRRAAQKDLIACRASSDPDHELLERFQSAYAAFARQHDVSQLPRENLQRLVAAKQLDLSWAAIDGVGELVFHAHVMAGSRARLLHSVSTVEAADDPGRRSLVGRANRLLHWNDMLRFKAGGVRTYDFGGWYDGTTDRKKLQINTFKESFGGKVERDYNAERLLTPRARIAVRIANLLGRRR